MKKRYLMIVLVLTLMVGITGCSSNEEVKNPKEPIRLATMGDPEGRLLGQMMLQVLEKNGYKVEEKVGTIHSPTLIREGMDQDEVDLTIDYTGRGLSLIPDVDESKFHDLETAFKTVKEFDKENGWNWITYSEINNTDGIAMNRKIAEQNNIKTMFDFAKYIKDNKDVKVAVSDTYIMSIPTGMPGWEKVYGFKLSEDQLILGVPEAKNMAAENKEGVVACTTYTTSGMLEILDLVVIEDTEMVAPVYSPAPIISQKILDKYPELEELLGEIFKSIDIDTQIKLNGLLEVEGANESKVAEDYLKEKGLL